MENEDLIPHFEGFKAIEAELQYLNEQEEATSADINRASVSGGILHRGLGLKGRSTPLSRTFLKSKNCQF